MVSRLAHATMIRPFATIQRERRLSVPGEVVVRIGQEVLPGQVVARARKQVGYHILPLSKMMRLPDEEVENYLLVKPGTVVEQGTLLFRKPELIRKKEVVSPVDGQVVRLHNGRLLIAAHTQWLELNAWVRGQVVSAIEQRGVVLQTEGALIQAIWGSGENGYGRLYIPEVNEQDDSQTDHLSGALTDHVIVFDQIKTLSTLELAQQIGVAGIITGSLSAELCHAAEEMSYPVIVTDGVGKQGMASPIARLLKKLIGLEASLFGNPPDKWGNRPEVIVPISAPQEFEAEFQPQNKRLKLAVGQRVRILRLDNASNCGIIKHIYKYRRLTELGFNVEGADVELPNGNVIFVPSSNLDHLL